MAQSKEERGPSEPRKLPEGVEIWYDVRDGAYWFKLSGRYAALKRSDIQMHLRTMGFTELLVRNGLREIDHPLWNAQINCMIDYAGSLAGHRVGIMSDGSGRKYLVTDEASGVFEPIKKQAKPEWFLGFIQQLLPDDQWIRFCMWLRIALESLRAGDFRPGQVVVLAGASMCGKSLLQSIITEVLGGRSASPFRYMMEQTQFNRDLASAEHWQIEDPSSTTDMRTRRAFGSKLKEATVNRDVNIHQKGKDALTLPIARRVSLSVNKEPENLAVIPPMDESMLDKIFLFLCTPAAVGADRKATWATVMKEIPLIRAWLLNNKALVPSKEFQDDRFGVKSWHHPELMAELSDLSPESRLLSVIDQVFFEKDAVEPESLRAMEIEQRIRGSQYGFAVEKLLSYSGACGSLLAKLSKSQPQRISKRVRDGVSFWTINPPVKSEEKVA